MLKCIWWPIVHNCMRVTRILTLNSGTHFEGEVSFSVHNAKNIPVACKWWLRFFWEEAVQNAHATLKWTLLVQDTTNLQLLLFAAVQRKNAVHSFLYCSNFSFGIGKEHAGFCTDKERIHSAKIFGEEHLRSQLPQVTFACCCLGHFWNRRWQQNCVYISTQSFCCFLAPRYFIVSGSKCVKN